MRVLEDVQQAVERDQRAGHRSTAAAATRSRSGTSTIATIATSGSVNSQPRLWTITASWSPAHAVAISAPRSLAGSSRRAASTIADSAAIVNRAAVALK